MDLKQLECLVAVVEAGSFTTAAVRLNLSQPVVSRYVRQLEVELNEHLLLRNGRGVVPTDAGRRLVEHGKGILRQVEVARHDLQENRGSLTGRVIVGLPPTIGRALTVALVTRFRHLYPKAKIGVVEALTASMEEALLLGRVDIALLHDPAPSSQLQFEPIWSEELHLIGIDQPGQPLGDTISVAAMAAFPLLLPASPHSVRNLLEARCRQMGLTINVVAEVMAVESQLELARHGVGFAVLPRNAVRARPSTTLKAARIVEAPIPTRIVMATSVHHPPSRLAQATIGLIKGQIEGGALA